MNTCDVSLCVLHLHLKHKIIISTYKFQIKMPNAKLETADELHAIFSDDEQLKGLNFIFIFLTVYP
jgi:hypothetical protein